MSDWFSSQSWMSFCSYPCGSALWRVTTCQKGRVPKAWKLLSTSLQKVCYPTSGETSKHSKMVAKALQSAFCLERQGTGTVGKKEGQHSTSQGVVFGEKERWRIMVLLEHHGIPQRQKQRGWGSTVTLSDIAIVGVRCTNQIEFENSREMWTKMATLRSGYIMCGLKTLWKCRVFYIQPSPLWIGVLGTGRYSALHQTATKPAPQLWTVCQKC